MLAAPLTGRPAVVAAVAGDPGGAAALAPVLHLLARRGDVSVRPLAYRQALAAWAAAGLAPEPLDEGTGVEEVGARLERLGASLLLAGTSFNGVDLEKRLIAAARAGGIPSLAVLDFWSCYRERFADADGTLAFLPDRIAVMDEFAREEMLRAGFPPERLAVTGQPAFDELEVVRRRTGPARVAELRRRAGVEPGERLVLFLSQPLAAVFGASAAHPLYPGYTEAEVLELLVRALDALAERDGGAFRVLVRPHPREDPAAIAVPAARRVRAAVSAEGDGREWALAAELVAGMTTVLLVEAALLGAAVVSLQPGRRLADPLPLARLGLGETVSRTEQAVPALARALAAPPADRAALTAALGADGGAAARVVHLVRTLLHPSST